MPIVLCKILADDMPVLFAGGMTVQRQINLTAAPPVGNQ